MSIINIKDIIKKAKEKGLSWFSVLSNISLIIIAIILLLNILNQSYHGSSKYMPPNYAIQYGNYKNTEAFMIDSPSKKIIKRANIYLKTKNYERVKDELKNIIKKYKGVVISENENAPEVRALYLSIKINSENLENFINEIKNLNNVDIESLRISNEDNTEIYRDYTERIKRYEMQIKKYKDMLNSKDIKIEDEIKIQNRIDQLEDKIFYINKSITDLDKRVVYSYVYITLKEKKIILKNDFLTFNDIIKIFLKTTKTSIIIFIYIISFILPLCILYIIYKIYSFFKSNLTIKKKNK